MPFVILMLIFILIIFYFFKLVFIILDLNQKPKTVYHNPIFGKIKKIEINSATPSAEFSFILDTIEGVPISTTESAKVYFLPPKNIRLGYREKAFIMAKNFGFDGENSNYKLENNTAIFSDEKQKLTIDIDTFNFSYQYFFENDPSLFEEATIPEQHIIQNQTIDFLKKINRYPEELALGKININLLYFDPLNKIFTKVKNSEEANAVEVNFFRPDIDNFPVVTPNFPSSQNYFLLVFKNFEFKILRGQIKFYEKSNENYGIYLLNSGEKVWQKLKNGEYFLINAPKETKKIIIKKMFLAYYDPDIYQPYLQPVYVFIGEPNFTAFTPAVADEYVE